MQTGASGQVTSNHVQTPNFQTKHVECRTGFQLANYKYNFNSKSALPMASASQSLNTSAVQHYSTVQYSKVQYGMLVTHDS